MSPLAWMIIVCAAPLAIVALAAVGSVLLASRVHAPAPGDPPSPGAGPELDDAYIDTMIERWRRSARD